MRIAQRTYVRRKHSRAAIVKRVEFVEQFRIFVVLWVNTIVV